MAEVQPYQDPIPLNEEERNLFKLRAKLRKKAAECPEIERELNELNNDQSIPDTLPRPIYSDEAENERNRIK